MSPPSPAEGPESESSKSTPDRSAPEGAFCSEHEARPALARCPLCGRDACIACWHVAADRCDHCLAGDRAAAAPLIPWEANVGVLRGFFGTLRTALSPMRSAPAFANAQQRKAWTFALLTTLPLALMSGVIPYTFTLRFGPSFMVTTMGSPSQTDIGLDVARAAGVGLLVVLFELLALGASYVSLCRSYAGEDEGAAAGVAALRGLLYRSFLLPLAGVQGLLASVAAWGLPQGAMGTADSPGAAAYVVPMLLLIPFALYFTSLRQTARLAAGLKPLPSFVVAIVPFVLMVVVSALAQHLLSPLIPGPMPLPGVGG
ncbi:MAG: hypothetical protein GXP55_10485 [Deltaproteobacteria bacterium]|nr:hypothetical protein [Deltaproteobacteria bacterium]